MNQSPQAQERAGFWYNILGISGCYRCFQKLTWSRAGEAFVNQYGVPAPGEKVLDIGCGPGDRLASLPAVEYTGFDLNPNYIREAKRRHGFQGRFFCGDVGSAQMESEKGSYNLVLAYGVLHHVDDGRAGRLFQMAHELLRRDGRLVTVDACYAPDQSRLSRWLVSKDRGQFVRDGEEYVRLASKHFAKVTASVRHDLHRIPYTHLLMRCAK